MPIRRFPAGLSDQKEDNNPAILAFGRRFFSDQTSLEYLLEFLLVAMSPKRIGELEFCSPLPGFNIVSSWPKGEKLEYSPRYGLNLKLFSFFGASKIDARHKTHQDHLCRVLEDEFLSAVRSSITINKKSVIQSIENLLLGFQGVGSQRTWCAQSFIPISPGLITGESIWNESKGAKSSNWDEALGHFNHNQHVFLARGGELLYLQICNALGRSKDEISSWINHSGINNCFTKAELDPEWVHEKLSLGIENLMKGSPRGFTRLTDFIDKKIDPSTSMQTDLEPNKQFKYSSCRWSAEPSWKEGYLFAIECLRICLSNLDLMNKLKLLEIACNMQILRSLLMQSCRLTGNPEEDVFPLYRLVISDPDGQNVLLKNLSKASVRKAKKVVYHGIRNPEIEKALSSTENLDKLYRTADNKYGYKLLITISKRLGFIVPKRGSGMRFVLNEDLLRLLVITLVPGERITLDRFLELAEKRFGFAISGHSLREAQCWIERSDLIEIPSDTIKWLVDMLEAAGYLVQLSDSCSLVCNPAYKTMEYK